VWKQPYNIRTLVFIYIYLYIYILLGDDKQVVIQFSSNSRIFNTATISKNIILLALVTGAGLPFLRQ